LSEDNCFPTQLFDIPLDPPMRLVPHFIDSILYSIVHISYGDRLDWYNAGAQETGIYPIHINEATGEIRCNMEIDGLMAT